MFSIRKQAQAHRPEQLEYVEYFGLTDLPFQATANPAYAYAHPSLVRGLTQMRNVVLGRTGMGMISGNVGLGKTTLAKTTENDMTARGIHAIMFPAVPGNSRQTEASIIQDITARLGIKKVAGNSTQRLYHELADYAERAESEGSTVVVIIDDAQNLKDSAVKTILRLLSLQTVDVQLIQILLYGQNPEMINALKADRALHTRLSAHVELQPFSEDHVGDMLNHRLMIAGRHDPLFTPPAVHAIAEMSGGIPRIICRVAHDACILAAERKAKIVELEAVQEAGESLQHSIHAEPHA